MIVFIVVKAKTKSKIVLVMLITLAKYIGAHSSPGRVDLPKNLGVGFEIVRKGFRAKIYPSSYIFWLSCRLQSTCSTFSLWLISLTIYCKQMYKFLGISKQ